MVNTAYGEKLPVEDKKGPTLVNDGTHDVEVGESKPAALSRGLQGRHMQMIAIGMDDFCAMLPVNTN